VEPIESIESIREKEQLARIEQEECELIKSNLTRDVLILESPPQIKDIERERNNDEPLSATEWNNMFDSQGRIQNVPLLRKIIFYGGVSEQIKKQVWKFLLGYYSFESTTEERKELDAAKKLEYERYKAQWTTITPKQESRFSLYRERQGRVEKDVVRTDRTHPYFKDESSVYLKRLYDILVTYSFYNFDLGYCQGMGDLASPILVVMKDEVESFWCFASLMETMEKNFQINSDGMEKQLQELNQLVKRMDRDLYNYLYDHDSTNFFFCFRWVLVQFKREFSFADTMRLWESIWSMYMGSHFHLFLCYAILNMHKQTIIDNQFGFDDILKYCIDLSCKMNVHDVLHNAELQLTIYKKKMDKLKSKYENK